MYRYFTAKQTGRYVDVLQDLVHAYDHTHHRSIGKATEDVTPDNDETSSLSGVTSTGYVYVPVRLSRAN